jgi:hypothetical protein
MIGAQRSITSGDVKARLRERYALKDGWITMDEVTPPKCDRRFDMLAIMGWQSRGHEVMGFEVKVSRGDWLAELKDPAKAEPLVRLCSRWWIAAPPDVVRVDELPPSWGLLVIHPEQIRTVKQAPTLEPEAWSDAIWRCMLLRCATREARTPDDPAKARTEGARESREASESAWKRELDRERSRITELEGIIRQAEQATGVNLGRWCNYHALGEAMQFLRDGRTDEMVRRIERDAHMMREAALRMRMAVRGLKEKAAASSVVAS